MLRLNIRHQLPQTAIRQQRSHLDEAAVVPAEIHTGTRQARSNKTVTQPTIQIDSYQSRRAYGARTMEDFNRERAQRGLSDVQAGTSGRTQTAWSRAENGAKRGGDIAQQIYNEMMGKYSARTLVGFDLMPGPTISVTPSQVTGDTDVGDVTADINTTAGARISYTPGSAETYIQNEGFIRRWVSEDKYDIYA